MQPGGFPGQLNNKTGTSQGPKPGLMDALRQVFMLFDSPAAKVPCVMASYDFASTNTQ